MTDRDRLRDPAAEGEIAARRDARRAALRPGTRARLTTVPETRVEIDVRGLEVEIVGPGGMVGEFEVRFLDVRAVERHALNAGFEITPSVIGVSEADYERGAFGWEYEVDDLAPSSEEV